MRSQYANAYDLLSRSLGTVLYFDEKAAGSGILHAVFKDVIDGQLQNMTDARVMLQVLDQIMAEETLAGSVEEVAGSAEEMQQAVKPHTAQAATSSTEEVDQPALGSATERTLSEDEKQQRLAYKRLARAILNEFIGNATFKNAGVEDMLRATLDAESQWDADMQARIMDVFEPAFKRIESFRVNRLPAFRSTI